MHTHKHRACDTSDTDQHPREWMTGLTLTWTSKNSAPKDSTCSLTAARVSKARTMAPMFFAVPMADRPATPPPMINTLAGGTLPAAVIWPVDNPGITLHHKVTKCSVQSPVSNTKTSLWNLSPPPPNSWQKAWQISAPWSAALKTSQKKTYVFTKYLGWSNALDELLNLKALCSLYYIV